jgi:hypothetical protein
MLRYAAILTLLVIVISFSVAPAQASDVTVTIENQQVRASLSLSLEQNITQLPTQSDTLNMVSNPQLSSAFESALTNAYPGAMPRNLTLRLDSAASWLNISTTMTVSGVSVRKGDVLSANMTWKDFYVPSDLRSGNLSYNTIGSRYFRPVATFYSNASSFAGRPNSTITGVNFFVNKTSVSGPAAENYLGNFTVFDFRALNSSLADWNRTYTLNNNTTKWRYSPPELLDLSLEVQQLNKTTTMVARYGYDAEIAVKGIARANGNILLFVVGNGQKELVMACFVALSVALAFAAQWMFRKKRKASIKSGRW